MDPLRSQFESGYDTAERLLIRHEHHGFFPDIGRYHRRELDTSATILLRCAKPRKLIRFAG